MTSAIFDIRLPEYVEVAIGALESAGYEAWCVGGCVRDALLGREVHDYDVACAARWEEAEALFEAVGLKTHRTGTSHGTLTVIVDGHAIEVTTFRADGSYSDGRHPDSVSFVRSIEEDLARRDFTINALAYHPSRGLLDCWGGLADLDNQVIRTVGDPMTRFSEDALRILRGCRFASQLGFALDEGTLAAMKSTKRNLASVSAERIVHELDALLLGDHVHDALMETVDVLVAVLPELAACRGFDQHTPYHIYDVWEHTAWVVQNSPATRLGRWAGLLHDIGKPAACFMDGQRAHFYGHAEQSVMLAEGLMRRLKLAPSFIAQVLTLVRIHDVTIAATPKSVRRALARMGGDQDLFVALCGLKRADALSQSPLGEPRVRLAEELLVTYRKVIEDNDAFTVKQLAVNGRDVMSLGVAAGPEVGRMLDLLLDAVIDGKIENGREPLLAAARALMCEK